MSTKVKAPSVAETLRAMSEQLEVLNQRVAALEAAAQPAPTVAAAPAQAPVDAGVDEETLLVISAAIAAFLGKTPRIRQIRLVGSSAWARQGRVGIHSSHAFARSGAGS
jgi:methylmalonyl-CoA carboxyltransferase large subunit